MPNRRGKLKEHVEGIHRNCEWIREHCNQSISMIAGENDQLDRAFKALSTFADQLDQFAQDLYSQF